MRKLFIFFFIFTGLASPTLASPEQKNCELRQENLPIKLSLEKSLEIALERHVNVIVAQQRVKQAVDRLGQSAAPLLPDFTLTSYQDRKTINLKTYGIPIPIQNPKAGPFNVFDARMTLSQTLFDLPAIERFRAANAGRKLAKADLKKTEQDVLALVGTMYLEAKRADEQADLMRTLLNRDKERLEVTQEGFHIGANSELELKQAESALATSRSILRRAEADKLDRRLDLVSALGFPANTKVLFSDDPIEVDMEKPSPTQALLNWEKTPDVLSAKETLEVDKLNKWAEVTEFLPKASGFIDYGASGNTITSSDDTYTFGIAFSLPIFEGGKRFFRLREAIHKLKESEAKLRDTELQTKSKIMMALDSLEESLVLLEAKEAEYLTAAKKLVLAEDRLKTGMGSHLNLLEASADLALARDGRDEAIATYQMAEINLARAQGKMETLAGNQEVKRK